MSVITFDNCVLKMFVNPFFRSIFCDDDGTYKQG